MLPRQRVFLANVEQFARLMRPGAEDLRITLPVLNDAIETGAPVLRRSPPVNRRLRRGPSGAEAARHPAEHAGDAGAARRGPANGAAAGALRRPGADGLQLLELLVHQPPGRAFRAHQHELLPAPGDCPLPGRPDGARSASAATRASVPTARARTGEFRPYEIPIVNSHPYGPTGQRNADCQPGQIGYELGRLHVPGQRLSDPANRVSDLPGSRGPTTAFWNADLERVLFDSRVESRQPETWKELRR